MGKHAWLSYASPSWNDIATGKNRVRKIDRVTDE